MQVVIWSDQGNEWIYGTVIKYTQRFFLWATHFGKRAFEDSEIIGIKHFKLLSKDNNCQFA